MPGIVINIKTRTTSLDEAKRKIRDFSQHGVSDIQATSAALRVMEGSMTNNLRAAERFAAQVLGLGPILKAAFPVVGAIAMLGVLGELGTKLYDFFHTAQEAPAKMQASFHEADASIQLTTDALRLSTAELENANAKLKGQPENGLKVAILEAVEAAHRLGAELDKDLKKMFEIAKEGSGDWKVKAYDALAGKADTADIAKELGGPRGNAGFRKSLWDKSPDEAAALLKAEIAKFEQQIEAAKANQKSSPEVGAYGITGFDGRIIVGDQSKRIDALEEANHELKLQLSLVQATKANEAAKGENRELNADKQNAALDRPFDDKIDELRARLEAGRIQLAAIGKDTQGQILAVGAEAYLKDLNEINKLLEKKNEILSQGDKDQLLATENQLADQNAQIEWKKKFTEATQSIQERIEAQKALNALGLGSSYEQRRDANTEQQIRKTLGKDYNTDFAQQHQDQIAQLRAGFNSQQDIEHAGKESPAIQDLVRQTSLYHTLAVVAGDFQATHQAELDAEITKMQLLNNWSEKQVQAYRAVDAAKLKAQSAERLFSINQAVSGSRNLAGAAFGGQDAERQAELENRIAEAKAKGASADEIAAIRTESQTRYYEELITAAGKLATSESDRYITLSREIEVLEARHAANADDLATTIALKKAEDDRLKMSVEYNLNQNTALSGVKAFFLEMQEQAEKTSKILYDSLNQVLDKTSANLANLVTGKKPKGGWGQAFGNEFKDVGRSTVQSELKAGLQTGLGALGKKFGIKGLEGKADGSSEGKALWVQMKNAALKGGGADSGIAALGKLGAPSQDPADIAEGLNQGGTAIPSGWLSALKGFAGLIPGFAEGGDVAPNSLSWVGENGPELFAPKSGGTIIPTSKIGGGDQHQYNIDARGAALGVEARIARAIDVAHASAIQNGVRAQHERSLRTPQRAG